MKWKKEKLERSSLEYYKWTACKSREKNDDYVHEGQSQEIIKKSKSLHEVLHEGSGKVLVSVVYWTRVE